MLQISAFKQVMIWLTCVVGLALAMPNLFYGTVERHNDAAALLENGQGSQEIETDFYSWPEWLPSGLVFHARVSSISRSLTLPVSIGELRSSLGRFLSNCSWSFGL